MRRDALPTPALVLDLPALRRNIDRMAAHAGAAGLRLRPHAKSHKSVEIARLLAAAGALGPACATIREAEAMAAGGLGGILVTSPMTTDDMLARIGRLLRRGADLTLVVDDPANVEALAALASGLGAVLPIVVELDAGTGRTGCASVEAALALARDVAAHDSLHFVGIQVYWGHLQQVMPLAERQRRVAEAKQPLKGLIHRLTEAGLRPGIVTGGGTGTSFLDPEGGLFTELQPGSFLFLDSCYGAVPLDEAQGNPFEPSLFVRAAVVSRAHPGRVVVNAGLKAFATDSGRPVPVRGAPEGAAYRFMGDEHGAVEFDPGREAPALGAGIELLTSHCDPTVNLHDRYAVVEGEDVVDFWPITRGF
jgi:D-serine deaminase-like pyridoxal phosphate-dependent protein